jgi:hypothetical protein
MRGESPVELQPIDVQLCSDTIDPLLDRQRFVDDELIEEAFWENGERHIEKSTLRTQKSDQINAYLYVLY